MKNKKLIIKIKTDSFTYEDGSLSILVDEDSVIEAIPNGVYLGFNWFKPLSLTTIRKLFLNKFNTVTGENT